MRVRCCCPKEGPRFCRQQNRRPAARRLQDVLFEPGSFNVQSRHHNLIAFSLDVGLLLKVLRSASGNASDRLEVKLVQKSVRVPGQEEAEPRPFMSFTARVGGRL